MENKAMEVIKKLNFQQVEAFFAVMEGGSFTKAGELMNMSQAAVSRIIAKLEWDTNLILFVRGARETSPTPAGRILYKEWKRVCREFQEGYLAAYTAQLGPFQRLNLGSVDMGQGLGFHISMLDWFEQSFSDYTTKITYERPEVLRDDLFGKKLDMIFINSFEAAYLERLGVKTKRLFTRPCKLCIQSWHPLYKKEHISGEDLKNCEITFFGSRAIQEDNALKQYYERYGLDVKKMRIESDFKMAVVSAARQTGVFLLEDAFGEKTREDVRCLLMEELSSGLSVAWIDEKLKFLIPKIMEYMKKLR